MSLKRIISTCRKYQGFLRKNPLGEILKIFGDFSLEDAGFFEIEDYKIVASTDGIIEGLVKLNPYMAGLYSVLVNVNDIVAKGAQPIGYMNVISSSHKKNRIKMANGVKKGIDLFGLKLLKGHLHPDHSYESIDASVIGVTENLISGCDAKVDDEIIMAIDLVGSAKSKIWIKCFDSLTSSSQEEIRRKISSMITIGQRHLANASRDISASGIIGSLSMMCESSEVGALCDLEKIPRPKRYELLNWLMIYPSMGFIISTVNPEKCCDILEEGGFTTGRVGVITSDKKVVLTLKDEKGVFIDLNRESVFGLK